MSRERYMPHIECNIFKAMNPTIVGFTTDDDDGKRNAAVHIGVVQFTKESLVPTYIIDLKGEEDRKWAMEKFHLHDRFPCVAVWSEGVLVTQTDPNNIGVDVPWVIVHYLRDILNYVITIGGKHCGGDIKAYRLNQLYEELKKEEEGGECHG